MICHQYFQPKTIQEAMVILREFSGEATILAGGTDLVIDLKRGKKRIQALVSISRRSGLNQIKEESGNLWIGARVAHAQATKSDLIQEKAPVLSEVCLTVSGSRRD